MGGGLCFVDVLSFHIYYQMSCQRRVTVNLVIILLDQGNVDNPRTDRCIWNNVHSNREQCSKTKRRLFSPEIRFIIKDETSEMLHLEHCFKWSWNLDTSGSTWGKYLGGFEMWCWRTLETISYTDRDTYEEGLQRVKEERNILQAMKRKTAKGTGHILSRNCRLQHAIEGKE
jgi:hypothetical protein